MNISSRWTARSTTSSRNSPTWPRPERPTEPHETSEAASLLDAVDAREIALALDADWLEDPGEDLARGVRRLAVKERRPRRISRRLDYAWGGAGQGTPADLPKGLTLWLSERRPPPRGREPAPTTFGDAEHRLASVLVELGPDGDAIEDVMIPVYERATADWYR